MKHRCKQWSVAVLAAVMIAGASGAATEVAAQPGGVPNWGAAGTGELKAGPLGLNSLPGQADEQMPVAMQIPDAGVDADVEIRSMVEGVMQDPTGPWVVSWYDFSALVGSTSNAVFAGHVDYWGVGPSVLHELAGLPAGAEIYVTGENGDTFTYAVESIERVNAYELSAEDLENIIGDTGYGALTIITCGGEFNGSEYLQRDVLRARLVSTTPATASTSADASTTADTPDTAGGGDLAAGGTATVIEDGVNLRAEPSTGALVVTQLANGATVTITGAAQDGDGYTWWPVTTADGLTGWIAADFLQPQP